MNRDETASGDQRVEQAEEEQRKKLIGALEAEALPDPHDKPTRTAAYRAALEAAHQAEA